MATAQGRTAENDTLPKLLRSNARLWGSKRAALRKKEFGIWREYTWQDCYDSTRAIYLGLAALGLRSGEGVCILGHSRPEWLWSELAAQAIGAVVTGPDTNQTAEAIGTLLESLRPVFVICQDQEQVDKACQMRSVLPSIRRIVYWQNKGLEDYRDPGLTGLEELIALGREYESGHPGEFDRSLESSQPDQTAIALLAQNGNNGLELFPCTHRFILSTVDARLPDRHDPKPTNYVTLTSPGSFFEQSLGFARTLSGYQTLNFVERRETALKDFREISPESVFLPSVTWDGLASALRAKASESTWLKRKLFAYGLAAASRRKGNGKQPGIAAALNASLASYTVMRPIKDRQGLGKVSTAYQSGGELSSEAGALFCLLGIKLESVYGTPAGIVSSCPDGGVRLV